MSYLTSVGIHDPEFRQIVYLHDRWSSAHPKFHEGATSSSNTVLKRLSLVRKEMSMYRFTRLFRLTILAAIMLLLPTTSASAALVRCRTDPIFVLSNGDVLSVILDIGTASANVRNIAYVLHVPVGVTVKKVAYTNMNLRLPESYRVYQDSPQKRIWSILWLLLKTPGVLGWRCLRV